jgi:predicted amidohydrolase
MKLYLVQITPELGNPQANLAKILGWVDRGIAAGADLIAFGECAREGYEVTGKVDYAALAEPVPGPATEAVRQRLEGTKTLVCFGMAERDARGDVYNSAPLIGANGVIGVARKLYLVHLLAPTSGKLHAEDLFFKAGQRIGIFDTEFGRIGIQICLDNRHPEIAQAQAVAGCWLKLRPAAVPDRSGKGSVSALDLARGIENQMCDLFVNLAGDQGGVPYKGGTSVIMGAKGVAAQASVGKDAREEALEFEVTPDDVYRARGGWHNVRETRPDLIKQLYDLATEYQYGDRQV